MFNKKYKKGMADAAKAYEAFGKKQEDAINQILEEVRKQGGDFAETIKSLNVNIDGLYDYLQSKEKAQLYTVYTPFDIKDLDKEEQLFLIGALFRLTTDKTPNEHQQDYLRSIQRYLDIKEPPFGTDPLAIENIEDIPAQKAILQAVMEYLYLQDGDSYDETELQQEFLDAFSVNNKGRQAIFEQVERLYKATGARGLAEKYGYVVDGEPTESVQNQTIEELENAIIALGKSESNFPTCINVHAYDFSNYEDCVVAGIEGSISTKSLCKMEAERCLDMYYNEAERLIRELLKPDHDVGIYWFFKSNFDKNYSKVGEAIKAIAPISANQTIEKINSCLTASKVYDKAKEILDSLAHECGLPAVTKYRALIEYDTDDPSEFEEGFMRFLSKALKTYGYMLYPATGSIDEDATNLLGEIKGKFNLQIQEYLFTSIVEPVKKILL